MVRGSLFVLVFLAFLVPPVAGQGPDQVHVALDETADGLVIQWTTTLPYWGQNLPQVAWRIGSGPENVTEGALAGFVPGDAPGTGVYVWSARLSPLPPGASVTYRAGAASLGYRGPFTVRAMPAPDQPLTFLAYGDIGNGAVSTVNALTPDASAPDLLVRDLARRQDATLLLIPGDLAYAESNSGWDRFFQRQEPLFATMATVPTVGNHDWVFESEQTWRNYRDRFVLPGNEQDFGFRAGPVYVIGLNSEMVCSRDDRSDLDVTRPPCVAGRPNLEQVALLERELQRAKASNAPWTLVYFHKPPFTWGGHHSDEEVQALWVPLFEKYDVDVVLAAHDHLYLRSHPMVGGKEVTTDSTWTQGVAPAYVTVGTGGRGLYDLKPDPPSWFAKGEKVHGLARFHVTADTFEMVMLRVDGSEVDRFSIQKASPVAEDERAPRQASSLPLVLLLGVLSFTALRRRRL